MDNDKKTPEGLDESFDEHELDIDVPDEPKPIEDVNLSDTQSESFSMFDHFDETDESNETNEFGEFELAPENKEVIMDKKPEEPLFDESAFGEHSFDENLFKDDFKIEDSFDEPLSNKNPVRDEDLFSSDAFESVPQDEANLDFPEGDTSSKLGNSQLFDYEPGTTGGEETSAPEELYGSPMPGGMGGGPGGKKAAAPQWLKSRRTVRVIVMLVLVGTVYGALRLFTGSHETTMPELATAPAVHPPKPIETTPHETTQAAAETTHPVPVPAPTPVLTPEHAQTAAPTAPVVAAAPTAPEVSAPAPVPAAPTAPLPTTVPGLAPQQAMPAVAQGPQSSLAVPAPATSLPPAGATTQPQAPAAPGAMPSEQIANKLSSLEASIMAIDDRLSTIAQNKTKAPENIQSISPFGKAAPEAQEVMIETLQDIDKKMSHLAELQSQVHILNKEVSALKNDVVQQSIIVGQNQAQINQNLVSHLEKVAPKMIVQAAIPGRAWLRSETGQLMTVIPGDEVPGYGRVVSIDPTTGTVVMSSRAVFREQ